MEINNFCSQRQLEEIFYDIWVASIKTNFHSLNLSLSYRCIEPNNFIVWTATSLSDAKIYLEQYVGLFRSEMDRKPDLCNLLCELDLSLLLSNPYREK